MQPYGWKPHGWTMMVSGDGIERKNKAFCRTRESRERREQTKEERNDNDMNVFVPTRTKGHDNRIVNTSIVFLSSDDPGASFFLIVDARCSSTSDTLISRGNLP